MEPNKSAGVCINDGGSYFHCNAITFRCYAYSNGNVYCIDDGSNAACSVNSAGIYKCYEPEK